MYRIVIAGMKNTGKTDYVKRFKRYCAPYAHQFVFSEVETEQCLQIFLRHPEHDKCLIFFKGDDLFHPERRTNSFGVAREFNKLCMQYRMPSIIVPTMVNSEQERYFRQFPCIPSLKDLKNTNVYAKPVIEVMNKRY